jgi:hypothetical protein
MEGCSGLLPFVDTTSTSTTCVICAWWYWLQPEFVHPVMGDIGAIQAQRYWADVRERRFTTQQVDPRPIRAGYR